MARTCSISAAAIAPSPGTSARGVRSILSTCRAKEMNMEHASGQGIGASPFTGPSSARASGVSASISHATRRRQTASAQQARTTFRTVASSSSFTGA
jgi:hypothetical protein